MNGVEGRGVAKKVTEFAYQIYFTNFDLREKYFSKIEPGEVSVISGFSPPYKFNSKTKYQNLIKKKQHFKFKDDF